MNLALKGGGWPFGLEKWYIDTLLPDGAALLLYLARIRLFGVPLTRFTAELYAPGAPPICGGAVVRAVRGGEDHLEFGPCTLDGEAVRWSTPGLSGELRFVARHPPVSLVDPFLMEGKRRLYWNVEVPDADVTGRIWWPGGERRIDGRGYRDRVWFDLRPWRFPIRTLVWGRAAAGAHAATWVEARTDTGVVAARWEDGVVKVGDATPAVLGQSRPILDTRVADVAGLRLGWLRPILRRLSGDPHEVKRVGPAGVAESQGVSIHEVVEWRC